MQSARGQHIHANTVTLFLRCAHWLFYLGYECGTYFEIEVCIRNGARLAIDYR